MLALLYCLGIIVGLLRKNDVFVRIYQFFIIWVLFVFNTDNADMPGYKVIYTGVDRQEAGFTLWRSFFYDHGVSFERFWFWTYSIALLIIFIAIGKLFKERDNASLSLMMIFPLPSMVIIIRNTMGIAIVLAALVWYLNSDTKRLRNRVIYAAMIIFAATLHNTTLFFLLFLFVKDELPSSKKIMRMIEIVIISIIILNIPLTVDLFFALIQTKSKIGWFSESNRIGLGFFIVLLLHVIEFLIVSFSYRCRNASSEFVDRSESMIENKMYSINVLSMFLIGFYTYNMLFFSRIFCVVIMLNCINSFHLMKAYKRNEFAHAGCLMQIGYIALVFVVLYFGQNFSAIGELFVNNSLLGNL